MKYKVKVTPHAKQNSLRKEKDLLSNEDVWYVRLQAKPVDGEANKALIEFLSKELNIPKRKIQLVSGSKSRRKIIDIAST